MSLVRAVYTTAIRLATPAILLHLARRTRRQTGTRDDWRARLGYGPRIEGGAIWIHAASAGEMQAAASLVAALRTEHPLRLTCFTASGRARAGRLLPGVQAELAPLDLPGVWRRFFARGRPSILILVESELWPNLLAAAHRAGVPVVLASARLTPDSARRLARVPRTARELIGGLAQVLAQTPADLERFVALGLSPERGSVTGNLKEALIVPADEVERGRALRTTVLANRRVWIAGSLHEGEAAAVVEAAARVREAVPDAVAILVPRHPERAEEFAIQLHARGIVPVRWNSLENPASPAPGAIVLVERIGVLLALYAAADVAFVGGTLAPFGGHNLLEPALLGLPVIVGPSLEQVRPAAERLKSAGALVVVCDAASLAAELIALLKDPQAAQRQGEAARHAVGDSSALAATLAALRPYL